MPLLRRIMPGRPLTAGLAAVALALLWQALTVRYNYGGNWTGLFCTGASLLRTELPGYVDSPRLGPLTQATSRWSCCLCSLAFTG